MPMNSLDTLPFAGIRGDEFMFIQSNFEFCQHVSDQFDQLNLRLFQYSDYIAHDQESNIDPENNIYNHIFQNYDYFSEQKFNEILNRSHCVWGRNISFVRFNSRSLNAHFENICNYLESLNIDFDIIAISETWA